LKTIKKNGDEKWYKDGKVHRDDGLAIIQFNDQHNIIYVAQYKDGIKIKDLYFDQA
jgi:hypothetical protein